MFVGAGMLVLVVLWVATFSHCLAFVIKLTNTIQIGIKRLRQRTNSSIAGKDSLTNFKGQRQKITRKSPSQKPIPIPHHPFTAH